MTFRRVSRLSLLAPFFSLLLARTAGAEEEQTVGEKIDSGMKPISEFISDIIFFKVPFTEVPAVLVMLAATALFLSVYFRFINLRAFGLALRTVRGRYSTKDDPGRISHFQALATALSGTVGLGNIAGVALAIGIGGPGAVLWMIVMGFLGMTSKFVECTLGVKYRKVGADGAVQGGGMFYLRDGLKEKGLGGLGMILAVIFAVACIGGALGAGNMFQINQAHAQVSETFNIFQDENSAWMFGALVAVLVGAVIIGGIVWIARVTEFLVPIMCAIYIAACVIVLITHAGDVPGALGTIVKEAFAPSAAAGGAAGGFIVALIQGIRRGVFSNEAGVGSAAIAHSAVKTRKPASEGVVALLEPFVDTVVVCTMTALVIVVTGMWKVNADVAGDSVTLRKGPDSNALELVDYNRGQMLKVQEKWQRVTSVASGKAGWIVAGSVSELEDEKGVHAAGEDGAVIRVAPGSKEEVEKLGEGGKVTVETERPSGEDGKGNSREVVWAKVSNPDTGDSGWVRLKDLTERGGTSGGIWLTSQAFKGVIGWFPMVLAVAVFLFAFSTMITWSYYGEQALGFLTGGNRAVALGYKVLFCLCVVIGSAASLGNILNLSDALFFAMVIPNLIGLYILLPVVKRELQKFREHAAEIDGKNSVGE